MSVNPQRPAAKPNFALVGIATLAVAVLALAGGAFALRGQLFPANGTPLPTVANPTPIASTPLPNSGGSSTPAPNTGNGNSATPAAALPTPGTISLRLSEGQPQPQAAEVITVTTGQPLSFEDALAIRARLPALPADSTLQTEFKLALQPIPPPLTGQTLEQKFPPPPEVVPTPEVATGPLQVLRYAPEGDIPIAPFINITFNQPMVPLATLQDLATAQVPVKVEPALTGTWRWLGTKTLNFQYDSKLIDRLPKATEYRVTVPAGTKSATGQALEKDVTWTFRTPPPKVVTTYPDSNTPQRLDPLFFVAFDQRIDPAAVLETIKVSAANAPVSVVLATAAEVEKDKTVSQLAKYALESRWLAFHATAPLPTSAIVQVVIGPGTPSAEGPLVTTEAQTYKFSTYAPLKIEDHGCSWLDQQVCRPLTPFYIRFNNPLDTDVFTDTLIHVDPELPGVSLNAIGNSITIQGATKGQTTYRVTVSGAIQDTFGQTLGHDETLTFDVGQALPGLYGPQQVFVTLDPAATKPVVSVYAINYTELHAAIYAVQPTDWPAFRTYLRNYLQTDTPPAIPGQLIADKTLRVEAPADTLTQVDVDLSTYVAASGGFGQFIVLVEPPKSLTLEKWQRFQQTVHAWVQITQLGLDASADYSTLTARVTGLKEGAPVAGVTVQAESGGATATTDQNGLAHFAIPTGASYLTAQRGADTALLPRSTSYWDDSTWQAQSPHDYLSWFVFDDRAMYRPGEEVHLKGWVRRIGARQDGDVGLAAGANGATLNYQITEPQGNSIGNGQVPVNALGGFDFSFTIPQAVNLGYAQIMFTAGGDLAGLDGQSYSHGFQIQEFRRPEFEVNARNESAGPYFAGGFGVVAVQASYYAGGPLPNADTNWQVTYSPSSYSPPNWPDFTFGTWHPWWEAYGYRSGGVVAPGAYGGAMGFGDKGGTVQTFSGKTDATGTHYLRLDFDGSGGPQPFSVVANATVMDVNRQAWGSATTLLVHPADVYVGLRSDRYFVERGTPLKVDFIVANLDGKAVADRPVTVRAARQEWKYRGGNWQQTDADVQVCQQGSQGTPVTCTFQTAVGGEYVITALVTDDQGRQNQSQLTRWVSGSQLIPARTVEQEQATLIPDKETYQPGDTAQILVQSPFGAADGLLTVSRSGVLYTQPFHIDESGATTLQVPIEEKHIPNLELQVDLTGSAPRTDDQGQPLPGVTPRPAYAQGTLSLSIPPKVRTLTVDIAPAAREVEPGAETTLSLTVRDAAGQPVPQAEVAVVAVDEAILALTNYQMTDPLTVFYTNRGAYLDSLYSRASIVLVNPLSLSGAANQVVQTQVVNQRTASDAVLGAKEAAAGAAAPMAMPAATSAPAATQLPGTGGGGAASQTPIAVRVNFNPLAVFAPTVQTDANGQAQVPVKLPDSLTRYRLMAVAVDTSGRKFGAGQSSLTARLPLMVRPSAPRFLNFGDQFELPVVLQNQTDAPLTVDVIARGANLDLPNRILTDTAGLRVTVPARDRVEVRFPASADLAGTAHIQLAAASGNYADAATVELPVYTPATTEAFATYGTLDDGAVVQPLLAPTAVYTQFGGLEVSTSSTALQALTDAVLYLVTYPFEGTEQISSRVLAIAALRDVLTAFKAEGLPAPDALQATVQSDLARLQGLQNDDGGFPYWRRGFDSIPFNTIHVAHALAMAQAKGYTVPPDMLARVQPYLRDIESHYPAWYSQRTRWILSAYTLNVRAKLGDRDPQKALQLYNAAGLDNLSLAGIGWLWPVLEDSGNTAALDAIRQYVNNHAVETPGAANFTTSYDEQTYLLLDSDRRTDAIVLDALITDSPQSDLIPKVVNGLLAHRQAGRWDNTQENVFVLLALDHYFNTFEAQTPDFVARLWLGDTYAGDFTFQGRTTDRQTLNVPMAYVAAPAGTSGGATLQNITLSKEGTGRLYYRLGLRYAPQDLSLPALDMGFVVQRRYEAVDNAGDVTQDAQGVWHIRAGARVRVHVTMVADNRRYHVALVDPLPAGLEIVNPALAVSGSVPQDPSSQSYRYGWWWWGTWYEHQNLRDNQAEAFTSLLWDGVYDYTYVARATTPGTFVVPPAKAEEMYSPEVFGRSQGDKVVVETK